MSVHIIAVTITLVGLLTACTRTPDSSLEANKELVRQFVAVYNDGDFDRLDQIMTGDVARRGQSTTELHGLEALKAELRRIAVAFPDQREEIHVIIAEGDKVVVYATWTGTQQGSFGPLPATGQRASLPFFYLFRIEGGKIAEFWYEGDNLNFLSQLGHYPP